MGTGTQSLVDSMDGVASGGLAVLSALMASTFGQIIIFVFGIMLLTLLIGAIFFVYSLVSKRRS